MKTSQISRALPALLAALLGFAAVGETAAQSLPEPMDAAAVGPPAGRSVAKRTAPADVFVAAPEISALSALDGAGAGEGFHAFQAGLVFVVRGVALAAHLQWQPAAPDANDSGSTGGWSVRTLTGDGWQTLGGGATLAWKSPGAEILLVLEPDGGRSDTPSVLATYIPG